MRNMAKLTLCICSLLLLLIVISETSYQGPCCTKNHDKPIPLKNLASFIIQNDTEICDIKSVIFFTVRKKLVCTNPQKPWVIRAMKHLEKLH